MARTAKQTRLTAAMNASSGAQAHLWGMKQRAKDNPPTAATGGFPYPARTCAEWHEESGQIVAREMSAAERRKDARNGSAMLRDAIQRLAA